MRGNGFLRSLLPALLGLLAMVPAAASGAATSDAPIERTLWAWVEIDAGGIVTAVQADADENELVAEVVATLVRELEFTPARRGDEAVASAVPLELGLRFSPDAAGNYSAAVQWARVQPVRLLDAPPPRYPIDLARRRTGGYVLSGLVVAADGRADLASLAVADRIAFQGNDPLTRSDAGNRFAEALRDVVPQWRFRVAEVDGEPLPVRVHVPTSFHPPVSRRPEPMPQLPEAVRARLLPQPEPKVERDDVVLPAVTGALADSAPPARTPEIEITASRVRTVEAQ